MSVTTIMTFGGEQKILILKNVSVEGILKACVMAKRHCMSTQTKPNQPTSYHTDGSFTATHSFAKKTTLLF